jgi:hypothetical protein
MRHLCYVFIFPICAKNTQPSHDVYCRLECRKSTFLDPFPCQLTSVAADESESQEMKVDGHECSQYGAVEQSSGVDMKLQTPHTNA